MNLPGSRIATAVVATLVATLVAEGGLRLAGTAAWHNPLDPIYDSHALVCYDPVLGFANRRGIEFRSWKGPGPVRWDHLNAFGLRQPEVRRAKPPGVRRLAVLGDSISFGIGVASYRDLYPHQVEELCNAGRSSARVEVLNHAVMGNTTWQARAGLPDALALDPDAMLVMLGNNDSRRLIGRYAVPEDLVPEIIRFDRSVGAWLPGSGSSVVLNLLRRAAVLAQAQRLRRLPEWRSETRVSLADFRRNLLAIAESCRARGIPLYLADEKLAVNPACAHEKTEGDRSKMENYPAFREVLREMASTPGVRYIDVGSRLEALRAPAPQGYDLRKNRVLPEFVQLFVEQDPIHLNPSGHAIVARAIFERLAADGLCTPGVEPRS